MCEIVKIFSEHLEERQQRYTKKTCWSELCVWIDGSNLQALPCPSPIGLPSLTPTAGSV